MPQPFRRGVPGWVAAFLRELTFAGDARLAAEWVGVSLSHVWMRRLQEPKFAAYWDAALSLNAALAAAAEARSSRPSTILRQGAGWFPSPGNPGEEQ